MTVSKTSPLIPHEIEQLKTQILKRIGKKVYTPKVPGGSEMFRMVFPLAPIDPISWLQVQSIHPKIYWSDRRRDFELAGVGQADLIHSQSQTEIPIMFRLIRQVLASGGTSLRYLGGMSFDVHESNDPCWQLFGNFYFILPRFEIIRWQGKTSFVVNFRFTSRKDLDQQRESFPAELEKIDFQTADLPDKIPGLAAYRHHPDRIYWDKMIREALDGIDRGLFEKIVLARQSSFEFASSLPALQILRGLKHLDPRNIYFYLQPNREICFLSGTPEILYSREGRKITSEAIAASRPRGAGPDEDLRLERELLTNPKDIKEHWFVLKSIGDILKPMCRDLTQQGKTSVLKQDRIQHLHAKFKGILKQHINDEKIITLLHPTPAVGGFPTKPALANLKTLEPFNRGWYAAPVGWISSRSAQFAVAIRCGLICENQLILYSGAGILNGSQADAEWNELNNKIAGYLKVLGIAERLNG
jgi:menaquinone-specific isochorismate synthase